MRKIDTIIIHCTATPEGREHTIADVRRWHTDPKPKGNGWSDVGYHYLVRLDGTVEEGRPLARQGAHARGHNAHSIGVAYVGGVDDDRRPKDTRTPAQIEAMHRLTRDLLARFPGAKVIGHRDVDALKACPCFDAAADWKAYIDSAAWQVTDDADPANEAASKPASKAATRGVGTIVAAAPFAASAFDAPWQTVAVIGGLAVALLVIALAVRPLRLKLFAAVGAPA